MTKKILIGSTLSVIILLASFSSIASAQTVKINEGRSNIFEQIKDKIENKLLQPGDILDSIFILIFIFIMLLAGGPGAP